MPCLNYLTFHRSPPESIVVTAAMAVSTRPRGDLRRWRPVRLRSAAQTSGSIPVMAEYDPKADLRTYLQEARDAVLWKLKKLSEYDVRRPMTPTGTNLLGLIKHLTGVEAGYFGETFGRPFPEPTPGFEEGAEPNADFWATPEETREQIVGLYQRACAHADVTIETLPLETIGQVPWWNAAGAASLHKILVHMIAETNRHAGHADIVRELIDGAIGLQAGNNSLAPGDQAWWETYRSQLERAAREASPGW